MVLTGAEIVVECLKEQGVDTVFGYPGGTILNVYDALYQHKNEIIFLHPMSRERLMRRTDMPELPEESVCVWQPAARGQRIW